MKNLGCQIRNQTKLQRKTRLLSMEEVGKEAVDVAFRFLDEITTLKQTIQCP
jgi:hypothetical protein